MTFDEWWEQKGQHLAGQSKDYAREVWNESQISLASYKFAYVPLPAAKGLITISEDHPAYQYILRVMECF